MAPFIELNDISFGSTCAKLTSTPPVQRMPSREAAEKDSRARTPASTVTSFPLEPFAVMPP